MTGTLEISSMSKKSAFLTGFFCFILGYSAFAQTEKDRNIPDVPRATDAAVVFEGPESNMMELRESNRQAAPVIKDARPNANNPLVRKENPMFKQAGEKDVKKESMSTLSFNLFLYIVDKFRED